MGAKHNQSDIPRGLQDLYCAYSVSDVATCIFVSDAWLPNIASYLKHLYAASAFAATGPDNFHPEDKIATHDQFCSFMEGLHKHLPSFPTLEDFVPEIDWGEVRFPLEGRSFRILYGSEYSYIYDFLMAFKLVYGTLDAELESQFGASPLDELGHVLRFQDITIESLVEVQAAREGVEIGPGHIEIPPKSFWEVASSFYQSFRPELSIPTSFLNRYSHTLGDSAGPLNYMGFGNATFEGNVLRAMFVRSGDQYFPVLPRRHNTLLRTTWVQRNEEIHEVQVAEKTEVAVHLAIHEYVQARMNTSLKEAFVSPMLPDGQPSDIVLSSYLSSARSAVAILCSPPFTSVETLQSWADEIQPKLAEAASLLSSCPQRILCRRRSVIAESQAEIEELVVLVVGTSMPENKGINLPKGMKAMFIDLASFLGMIDELPEFQHMFKFQGFVDNQKQLRPNPFTSYLDIFASFKSSHGVLIQGATNPDMIWLDVAMGSQMRFETLSEFWRSYPVSARWDDPREWRVETTARYTRLIARGFIASELHTRVGAKCVTTGAPFPDMEFDEARITDLMMQCIADAFAEFEESVAKIDLFQQPEGFHVWFCPGSLTARSDGLGHVAHLADIPSGRMWVSDWGRPAPREYGIRIVFDMDEVQNALMDATDRSFQMLLFREVLEQINNIEPSHAIAEILQNVNRAKSGQPRFKLFMIEKRTAFPEGCTSHRPSEHHSRQSLKRIAELAKGASVREGRYRGNEAKEALNALRQVVVDEMDHSILRLNAATSLPLLVDATDALIDEYHKTYSRIEFSVGYEVDYDRAAEMVEAHRTFIETHRAYRYLIEKMVQHWPGGEDKIDVDRFRYLAAMAHWIQRLYAASDSIHYSFDPVLLTISHDFVVDAIIESEEAAHGRQFEHDRFEREIGLVGRSADVPDGGDIEQFLDEVDCAFNSDFGFTLRALIQTLHALALWPRYGHCGESPHYAATAESICAALDTSDEQLDAETVGRTLQFLTLRHGEMTHVLGQDEEATDLPVWEYRKRPMRYNLRPLLDLGDKLMWGPCSADRAAQIWAGPFARGSVPYDLQAPAVAEVITRRKRAIDNALEVKATEIVQRFTPYVERSCELHRIAPGSGHPDDLGDFDVLAYGARTNTVLNIECKHNPEVFCLKDARRLRERIFGRNAEDQGHFAHIGNRVEYLRQNLGMIANDLRWKIVDSNPPAVVTLYVERRASFVTKGAPENIDATFLEIERLHETCEELLGTPE